MSYDALVIAAHADAAETQMGGALAKLSDRGQRILLVDLTDGEPTEFAAPGVRATQALQAARMLGVERCNLGLRDRLLQDTSKTRLELARLIRLHRPRWVYSTGEACVHPDHAATVTLTRAAVFLARLRQWDRVIEGESLSDQEPWIVERTFFAHCKMEPPWADFAFAVDMTPVYERKRQALGDSAQAQCGVGDFIKWSWHECICASMSAAASLAEPGGLAAVSQPHAYISYR